MVRSVERRDGSSNEATASAAWLPPVTVLLGASLAAMGVLWCSAASPGGTARPPGVSDGEPFGALFDRDDPNRLVRSALASGAAWLSSVQEDDGGWSYRDGSADDSFGIGVAALCGLAQLHAGVPRDDEHVLRTRNFVVDEIRARWSASMDMPSIDVYSAGLAVTFLLESGSWADDRTVLGTVRMLEDAYGTDGYWDYRPAWAAAARRKGGDVRKACAAPRRGGGNVSATLYAIAGLSAASERGIAIDGRGLDLCLAALRDRQAADGGFFYFADEPARHVRPRQPYWGGTCGSVAAYLMAGEIRGLWSSPGEALLDPLVRSGLAWIEAHPEADTRSADRSETLLGEPVYGLFVGSRVTALLGLDRVLGEAWHAAGAKRLLGLQRADGSWDPGEYRSGVYSPEVETALALLVLAPSGRRLGEPLRGARAASGPQVSRRVLDGRDR